MTQTLAATFIDPADLRVGDVIDFFGEFHTVEQIVTPSNPLIPVLRGAVA